MKRYAPYWSCFRVRALLETQYRGAALGGMATQLFFALALICLYRALYAGGDARELGDIVTYVWLQQMLFRAQFSTDTELTEQIMKGGIAYTLLRPVDQQLWWSCRQLAIKLVGVVMRLLPMLALQCLLPREYRMLPPESAVSMAQLAVSLALGFLCLTEIASLVDVTVMITLDRRGAASIVNLAMAALSGNVIPLTLFPQRLQCLMRYQPFAQALDAPIRMYQHAQTAAEWGLNTGVQLLWLLALTALARALWKRQLGRMIVQGG